MQQDAGLRLKCLGGRLACGRWPISLIYRATEWSYYGAACATSSCFPRGGKEPTPGGGATPRGGRVVGWGVCWVGGGATRPRRGEAATSAGWQSHSPLT